MEFKEIVTPSLTDLFIQEMQRMILSGELKVGAKLPTERELSKDMKVSRAVINGGLNQLATMGFLRIAPRKGVFVNDYIANGNVSVLTAIMNFNNWQFTPQYLEPLLQLRSGVEPYTVLLAAEHATPEMQTQLKDIVQELKDTSGKESAAGLIFKFYHTMALASKNVILPLIYQSFEQVYQALGLVYIRVGQVDHLIADFEYFCEAIADGEGQEAKKRAIASIEVCRVDIGTHYQSGDAFEG